MGVQGRWEPDEAPPIETQEGVMAPPSFTVTATGEGLPFDVEINVVLDGGAYVAESMTCRRRPNGPGVTGEHLREIKVAELVRLGWRSLLKTGLLLKTQPTLKQIEAAKRRGPTDEALRVAATIYRLAVLEGRTDPTAYVAATLELPRSTAARWVQTARRKNILGR